MAKASVREIGLPEIENIEWHEVARADELMDGAAKEAEVGEVQIAVYSIGGQVYATSNVCTHQYALLTDGYIDGDVIECPLHQAQFHIPTGRVLSQPADQDIATYPTKITDGRIFVGLPKKQ